MGVCHSGLFCAAGWECSVQMPSLQMLYESVLLVLGLTECDYIFTSQTHNSCHYYCVNSVLGDLIPDPILICLSQSHCKASQTQMAELDKTLVHLFKPQ